MINTELTNLIIKNQDRIEGAIATGAAWEIWMQTELHIMLMNAHKQVVRELPYPHPNERLRLDLGVTDNNGTHAMELKVESANNAFRVLPAAKEDMLKIANFIADTRWVIAIAYSAPGKQALKEHAALPNNNSIYAPGKNIGVLVTTV